VEGRPAPPAGRELSRRLDRRTGRRVGGPAADGPGRSAPGPAPGSAPAWPRRSGRAGAARRRALHARDSSAPARRWRREPPAAPRLPRSRRGPSGNGPGPPAAPAARRHRSARPTGSGVQQQRQQRQDLRLARHQLGYQPRQPHRIGLQVDPGDVLAAAGGVRLGGDQVTTASTAGSRSGNSASEGSRGRA